MEMIRPVREEDYQSLLNLIGERGKGITNLPRDPVFLKKKIQDSLQAFAERKNPSFSYFLFVLENTESRQVIGTCGIQSKTGGTHPVCFYRIEEERKPMRHPSNIFCLYPVCYREGPSEVCGLYLKKAAREKGLGRLLSLSRFLFIASFPEMFTDTIAAEMRGLISQEGKYFFWENFGRLFYDIPGDEANKIRVYRPEKVPEMLPAHPIYLCLMPPKVQNLLHETHVNTKPALEMLYEEGFQYINEIDVIDAGPKICAQKNRIRTIQNSRKSIVKEIYQDTEQKKDHIISNALIDFRCCFGLVKMVGDGVGIDENTAKYLNISIGDAIAFAESKPAKSPQKKL